MPHLLQSIRDNFTEITPEEGKQRAADYRALFDNLGSSIKGAFKNSEITAAGEMQGTTKMTPESALVLHLVNLYQQEEQKLALGKNLVGPDGKDVISKAAVDKLIGDTITDYVKQTFEMGDRVRRSSVPVNVSAQEPPKLVDLINKKLFTDKLGMNKEKQPPTTQELNQRREDIRKKMSGGR
jgi:hypothetical protein